MLALVCMFAAYVVLWFSNKVFGGPFAIIGVAGIGFCFFLLGNAVLRMMGL